MTRDEARERFSAAYDRELDDDERQAFEAVLGQDKELKREFEEFVSLLGRATTEAQVDEEGAPDLLVSVQAKLRTRSRGRFYRDRFSQKRGSETVLPIVFGILMLVIIGVAWAALSAIEIEDETRVERGGPS